MAYWTTEEVADFLEITVEQVYESRRRKEYPGNIGKQRGRRLMFDAALVEAGPTEPETTEDPLVAILWALNGIEKKLGQLVKKDSTINVEVEGYRGASQSTEEYRHMIRQTEALERIADNLEPPEDQKA